MEAQIAILDAARNVAFSLDEETTVALGLAAGSRLAVSVEADRIILKPIAPDDLDELCGIFSGKPGMEDDLHELRREQEEQFERKYGW